MLKRYHMNKREREIRNVEKVRDILRRGKYITLALSHDDKPYTLTLSYGLDDENDRLYFHTALKGLKLKIMERNPRVCGTVVEDLGYRHGECSHRYRSLVLSGTLSRVEDLPEKKHGLMTMLIHLEDSPNEMRQRFLEDDEAYSKVNILRLDFTEMTGKESE